jgi:hypothetical protein
MSLIGQPEAAPQESVQSEAPSQESSAVPTESSSENLKFDLSGVQERPDFIPEQFWDPKEQAIRTESFLNSYKTTKSSYDSLQSKYNDMDAKLKQIEESNGKSYDDADGYLSTVVQDGKYIAPEGLNHFTEIPSDDPGLKALAETAKEYKLTDKQFKGMVDGVIKNLDASVKPKVDPEVAHQAEMQKLGKDAKFITDSLGIWLGNLKQDSKLTEGAYNNFLKVAETADGVRALYELRQAYDKTPSIPKEASNPQAMTKEKWKAMMHDPRFKTDPAFKDQWRKMSEKLFNE